MDSIKISNNLFNNYRKTLRDLQRHESASKSPIFSFATATLQGLDTIHAFKKESQFIEK